MALPQIRIHTQTTDPRHPVSHRSGGPTRSVDLTLPAKGWQAIMDGTVAMGKGISEIGKAMRGVNGKVDGMKAFNAMEDIKAESEGRPAYHQTFASVW